MGERRGERGDNSDSDSDSGSDNDSDSDSDSDSDMAGVGLGWDERCFLNGAGGLITATR